MTNESKDRLIRRVPTIYRALRHIKQEGAVLFEKLKSDSLRWNSLIALTVALLLPWGKRPHGFVHLGIYELLASFGLINGHAGVWVIFSIFGPAIWLILAILINPLSLVFDILGVLNILFFPPIFIMHYELTFYLLGKLMISTTLAVRLIYRFARVFYNRHE